MYVILADGSVQNSCINKKKYLELSLTLNVLFSVSLTIVSDFSSDLQSLYMTISQYINATMHDID